MAAEAARAEFPISTDSRAICRRRAYCAAHNGEKFAGREVVAKTGLREDLQSRVKTFAT